jgi:putative restriction endonuclease
MSVNQNERAFRAWPILTGTASHGATITYSELAHRIGIHHRPVRFVLGVIQDYCLAEKLPPLTIVVVNQLFRQPGEGFLAWDVDDLAEGYRRVYAYQWEALSNPFTFADHGDTPDQLARRLVGRPQDSKAVYQRIKNRGIAQMVFRQALLIVYERRCAFCRLSLTEALEAAHIIPWSKASIAQRISPTNGLLLCSTHHALFDANTLAIAANGTIVCNLSDEKWSDVNRQAALVLHGQAVWSPLDPRLRPTPEILAYRAKLGPSDLKPRGLA